MVGPQQSRPEEQVAFAVIDDGVTVEEWQVGDDRFSGQVLVFTPTEAGRVNIEAVTDDGNRGVSLEVVDDGQELIIGDSPVLPLGETTVVSVQDADGDVLLTDLTWTVGGESYSLSTLELLPSEPGTIVVTVNTADGREAVRTFTVPAEDE